MTEVRTPKYTNLYGTVLMSVSADISELKLWFGLSLSGVEVIIG